MNDERLCDLFVVLPSVKGVKVKVRKGEVRTSFQGVLKSYLRPISDIIVLLKNYQKKHLIEKYSGISNARQGVKGV